MTHVLITAPFPEPLIKKVRALSSDLTVEIMSLPERKWPVEKETQAEIYYALTGVPTPEQAPNLRWVQAHWAGVDSLLDHPVWHSDILITTASGIHTPNIAQYTFAQILTWTNRVLRWRHFQKKSEWPADRWDKFVPQPLRGSTLGIVGYGSIGREIARIAKSFGMQVLACKRNARHLADDGYTLPGSGDPEGTLPDRIYPTEATRSMLAECDFVVNILPLTEGTRHFFSEELFKVMKSSSFLINVGRGDTIDEAALVRALKRGWIAGAGLDVFATEPLPQSSPLWQMDNVIISPHVSGFTPYYDERAVDLFIENLRRYLAGEPLLNVVNREYGY